MSKCVSIGTKQDRAGLGASTIFALHPSRGSVSTDFPQPSSLKGFEMLVGICRAFRAYCSMGATKGATVTLVECSLDTHYLELPPSTPYEGTFTDGW